MKLTKYAVKQAIKNTGFVISDFEIGVGGRKLESKLMDVDQNQRQTRIVLRELADMGFGYVARFAGWGGMFCSLTPEPTVEEPEWLHDFGSKASRHHY